MSAKLTILLVAGGLIAPGPLCDAHVEVSAAERSFELEIANGSMVVFRPVQQAAPNELLIHFHGDPETVHDAFMRCEWHAILVVVNFPGLSSAYSTPFEKDDKLFNAITSRASEFRIRISGSVAQKGWERLTVSSFSAGYGAVRQIVGRKQGVNQIDAVVCADSIYAGIETSSKTRTVNEDNMRSFLDFAQSACRGEKIFILSHSSQPTSYASTTETADYLIQKLGLTRRPEAVQWTPTMRQTSRASKGRFLVLGFEGESAEDHLAHLRNIDLLWQRLEESAIANDAP